MFEYLAAIPPICWVLLVMWFFSALVDYLEFCYVWQFKEYRLDRMKDFFNSKQGQLYSRGYRLLWRPLGAIAFYLFLSQTYRGAIILVIIFGLDLAYNTYKLTNRKLRRPVFTKKAILLITLAIILEGIFVIVYHKGSFILILFLARFLSFSAITLLFQYPTKWAKAFYISLAKKKLKRHKKLIVIGVTGSYGKTSVKTYLTHILQHKYKTIRTPKNINTEIGVAQFILKTNFKGVDVFVVEMGAYKPGEIALTCAMVQPKIGILTAINEQHLVLFQTIENTQKAKYELLRSLPEDGLAITNSDNEYCRGLLHTLKCKVQTFGCEKKFSPTCLIEKVEKTKEGIDMRISLEEKQVEIKAPTPGLHTGMNIAPCILAAKHLGMSTKEIVDECATLKNPDMVLRLYQYGKSTIIDDSYNANPDGFKAALNVLASHAKEREKIVITRGMLELGEKSDELHERISEEISFCADTLIIIHPDSEAALRAGIIGKYKTKVMTILNPAELMAFLEEKKETDAVILLENKIPPSVYENIVKK